MAVVMIRIGLTGGIAAGKSTVATHLRELGATLVDYDVLARKVVEPEAWACNESWNISGRMR